MKKREFLLQYAPVIAVGALIVTLGIIYRQPFYKMLPMLNTLVIMLLSANANRYSFLFGGLNSVVYGIVYLSEHVYFSAISAMLVSFPLQMFSFFHWRKREQGKRSPLKMLGVRGRLSVLGIGILAYGAAYFLLLPFFSNAAFPAVDILVFVLGVVVTVLIALCYVEGQYLNVLSCLCNLVLWLMIALRDPSNLNYLVIGAYNLFRVLQGCVVWTRKYRAEQTEMRERGAVAQGILL